MLTAEGCRKRRQRLWERVGGEVVGDTLVFGVPAHLHYLANAYADPTQLGSDTFVLLAVRRDGHATLFLDDKACPSLDDAHVDERVVAPWYDGRQPPRVARPAAAVEALAAAGINGRVHDRPGDPLASLATAALADCRRAKDADELTTLRQCMAAGAAGHARARQVVRPGVSELEVYGEVAAACSAEAGRPVVVYGDFAVSPGPARAGGPPTRKVLEAGDLMILDFSVVIAGYRSDFTNTIAVGGAPSSEQARMFEACTAALAAGEAQLKEGAACQAVYDAVRGAFAAAGLADHFPHHAGHGIGLSHPEAPFFVEESAETLRAGDVVTLEPGLYVGGVGGMRVEHNYLVTAGGAERLSHHLISLT